MTRQAGSVGTASRLSHRGTTAMSPSNSTAEAVMSSRVPTAGPGQDQFSEAERRVLQHAADILKVSFSDLVRVSQSGPGLAIAALPDLAVSDIPDFSWQVDIDALPLHSWPSLESQITATSLAQHPHPWPNWNVLGDLQTQDDVNAWPDNIERSLFGDTIFPAPQPDPWFLAPLEALSASEGRQQQDLLDLVGEADTGKDPDLDVERQETLTGQTIGSSGDEVHPTPSYAIEIRQSPAPSDNLIQSRAYTKLRQRRPLASNPVLPSAPLSTLEPVPQILREPRSRPCIKSGDGRRAKRRGPLKLDQRIETSLTRRNKACIRCHMQRIRCLPNLSDPFGCCLTCLALSGPTMSRLPCLRYKISDSQLVDKAAHPRFSWTTRFKSMKMVDIEDWRSPEIKTIMVTQVVNGVTIPPWECRVREFIPAEGDALARTWDSKAGKRSHPCSPYAIVDMREAGETMSNVVDKNVETYIRCCTDENDKLLRSTYSIAYRYSQLIERKDERSLLRSVLRLWVASRMGSNFIRIVGPEVLNMTPQDYDKDARNFGCFLLPPVMQAQSEILTTAAVLLPVQKAILKGMQDLVEKSQIRSWFAIYLTTFILLHSCALLTRAEALRGARHGTQCKYFNPQLVEELHNGARTMLAYFHHCNKGSHPFSIDWENENNVSFAELDMEQVEFLKDTVSEIEQKGERFKYIKQNKLFEDDYYFVSQLYEMNWRPIFTV